ncbi:hypothetical protein Arad_0641 [Rhizobium rhizogenes K84]|uniref:Uncharacterized protein n=1 Tax=Rhizobium rhizogenes (strain K84 / ATCC BAA-868) TaxID=311403 RepID=B9J898_RHIR8|nr:hypothetical protein Arad_0641 [Rhizobium rhizogenes K84]
MSTQKSAVLGLRHHKRPSQLVYAMQYVSRLGTDLRHHFPLAFPIAGLGDCRGDIGNPAAGEGDVEKPTVGLAVGRFPLAADLAARRYRRKAVGENADLGKKIFDMHPIILGNRLLSAGLVQGLFQFV